MVPQHSPNLSEFAEWSRSVSAGPLRPWVTVVLAIFAVVMATDVLQQHPLNDPQQVILVLASLVTYSSASVVSRWPWTGFLIFITSSFTVAWFADSGAVLVISCAVVIAFLFMCGSALLMMTASVTLVLWAAFASLLVHSDFSMLRATAVVGVPVACIGFVIGRFRKGMHVAKALNRELEQQNLMIRAREREALARDLHDIVANQLTSMTLIASSRSRSKRLEDLQEALNDIEGLSQDALIELRKLLDVLRTEDTPFTETRKSRLDPDILAAGIGLVVSRLQEFDFAVNLSSDHQDQLDSSVSTVDVLVRILQECCTNALKYALPLSTIQIALHTDGQSVSLKFASMMRQDAPTLPSDETLSSGQGLIGIRERVRLLGGKVSIGPSGDQWLVEASFPHDDKLQERYASAEL